ncbi:MAG: DUF1460 domain-containing protein [Thermodesulfovibrio sp.]|nr:DUF1460 domain-containing protein [Thermodesulfovibrio sp.]
MTDTPGRFNRPDIEAMLAVSAKLSVPGDRIAFLSRRFLGVPYQASTLTSSAEGSGQLVLALEAVDCFTLLDYVEALRRATNFDEFTDNLIRTRYRHGIISYTSRNHFFTDWLFYNAAHVFDATGLVGGEASLKVEKVLNRKQDGSFFVRGISPVVRTMAYIPAAGFIDGASEKLLTGDYAGIYSELPGLDVSHVGIVVRDGADIFFRHASARYGEVVDEDFTLYVSGTPGVVILRPQ